MESRFLVIAGEIRMSRGLRQKEKSRLGEVGPAGLQVGQGQ